jgi:pSer/pThr/pTyr-binding forkhead associated (FHA) protein
MWLAFGTQTWELRDGEVTVGSGADADWRIATADLKPRHFTITIHGLNASLRATSKENVVVVNDRQLVGAPYLLNDGDVIAAGAGRFVFGDEAPRPAPTEPEPAAAGFLIEENSGVPRQLLSRSTTFGRDPSSTIRLMDPSVSRFHAEIRREAGGFALHSMGSAGTLLNGRRVSAPLVLGDGDVVEIGRRRWRFSPAVPGTDQPPAHRGPEPNSERAWQRAVPETGHVSVVPAPNPVRRTAVAAAIVAIVALAAAAVFLMH